MRHIELDCKHIGVSIEQNGIACDAPANFFAQLDVLRFGKSQIVLRCEFACEFNRLFLRVIIVLKRFFEIFAGPLKMARIVLQARERRVRAASFECGEG